MSSTEEGGATGNGNPSSSYGGGGAGGKFRKKPLRRQATPYDRPPAGLRGNTHKPGSWLAKIFVDPAYKLISYGAERFFASVFRKRLPAPPLPHRQPDMKPFLNDTVQAAVVNDKEDVMDTAEGSLLMNDGSYSNGISELEQMLMQKTLTRSEIVHLTELLKSKEAGVSSGDSLKERNVSASDYGKHQMLAGGFVGGNINGGRLSASTSTPFRQFKVPADDVASPAELAKNYMGSRGSKVSPSMLGVQRNYSREDSEFRNNGASASKSLFVPSTEKKSISSDAIKNDFTTPRSRGRSAIYDMARTPYSRNHSSLKGLQFNNENGNTGAAASYSASLYLKEKNDEIYESRNLKRRSSVLDGEVGYIGPVRRIRQKSNLLAPPVSHIPLRVGSNAKQNLEMIGEPRILGQNENQDSPSTSYAHVPPKSSEMAAKILKQLEKLSPAEKLLESQSALGLKKSKLSLTASMLSGKALRSMEAIESPKMLLDFQDEKKSPDLTKKYLPDEDGTLLQKPGNKAKELPRESVSPSDTQNGALLSQPFMTDSKNATSGTENGASLPSQTNRAFKMSAKEDSFELDDDFHSTGDTFRNFSEAPGVVEPSSSSCNVLSSEDVKITTNESGFILPSVLTSSKAHVIRPLSSSEIPVRSSVALPASNEPPGIASQSSSLPPSVEKPKEANDPTLVLSSTSKVDTFPSPSSKFAEEAESRKESPISLIDTTRLSGSQVKNVEFEEGAHLTSKNVDEKGKFGTLPLAVDRPPLFSAASSNNVTGKTTGTGLLFSEPNVASNIITSSAPSLFSAASSVDVAEKSTGSGLLFSYSTGSAGNITPSTSALFSGNIFGPASNSSSSSGLPGVTKAPLINKSPEVSGFSATSEKQQSSGISSESFSFPAVGASSSGNITVENGSNLSQETAGNLNGSLFGNTSKTLLSANGASLNANGSSSLGFSSSSQAFNSGGIFTSSASASSSDTTKFLPHREQSSNVTSADAKDGSVEKPVAISGSVASGNGSSASLISAAGSASVVNATQAFSFASSTGALGSGIGNNLPFSGFPASSSGSSAVNTSSSFSNGSSGVFVFGGSSAAAPSTAISSSSASLSVFGSSWQTPKSPAFGAAFTSFGGTSSSLASSVNTAPSFFSSSAAGVSPFAAASSSAASSSPFSISQPVFGKPLAGGFTAAFSGNNDQMNSEDSMAEDPVQSSGPPSFPAFGQSSAAAAPGFSFGLSVPPPTGSPFVFSGQQNPPPVAAAAFQSSGSLEFNAGGAFSMGSGGVDKSRRTVRVSKSKNRKNNNLGSKY